MRRLLVAVALSGAALSSGCVQNYAARDVSQGLAEGMLVVVNAPAEARIVIDGRDLGAVGQQGAGVPISPGRHDILITAAGQPLHSQAVFASAGARIEVRIP